MSDDEIVSIFYPMNTCSQNERLIAISVGRAIEMRARRTECAPRDVVKALFEVLMRRNIECGSEAYLTLRCVGVPPSKKEFVRAIEHAVKGRP